LGKHFSLVAADSFKLGAYRADPSGTPKGGIVVIQEIFGVNHHIRAAIRPMKSLTLANSSPIRIGRQ
jgi:dienelactone hydrolase